MNRTRIKRSLLAVLVLAGFAALGVSIACVSTPDEIGLHDGRLSPCPDSPNCVCSEERLLASSVEPLAFSGEPGAAFQSLVEFLQGEPDVELVTIAPDYLHAVYSTAILRFRDDVEFRLDATAGVVHVRSASRVGYSDLGANRKRIESLRARWKPPVAEAAR